MKYRPDLIKKKKKRYHKTISLLASFTWFRIWTLYLFSSSSFGLSQPHRCCSQSWTYKTPRRCPDPQRPLDEVKALEFCLLKSLLVVDLTLLRVTKYVEIIDLVLLNTIKHVEIIDLAQPSRVRTHKLHCLKPLLTRL